jgi:DNA-binding MarR family transcriptional regulator
VAARSFEWRKQNVGRALFSATDLFVREKLRILHEAGFGRVMEAELALYQNLDLGGTRLTTIAARAMLTKPSMMELVDKAEARGFVGRTPDITDRRAKIVRFTPAGLEMLEGLRKAVTETERRMAVTTGHAFLAEMKAQLTAYIATSDTADNSGQTLMLSKNNAAWRIESVGRVLYSGTNLFVSDILRFVQKKGFESFAEVHLALLRNLDLKGSRLTQIAARARMTKPGMQELVDKAEDLGFVERTPDPLDRRAKTVMFTPSGLRLLDRLGEGIARAEERMVVATSAKFVKEMKVHLSAYSEKTNPLSPATVDRDNHLSAIPGSPAKRIRVA